MPDTTTAIWILFISLTILLLLRVPITFTLVMSSMLTAIYLKIPLLVMAQQMVKGVQVNALLALPFFILVGDIMGEGGISKRLIDFSNVIVGRVRGGLALVNVLACMFFGGISGSAIADASAVGSTMIPMMKKKGYDADYSVGVTICAACQGIMVPPSHNMILYSVAAGGISIGSLFLAGTIPGILLGISLMILSYIMAIKRNYPKGEKFTFRESVKITKGAILGLLTAIIIVVGVISGVFTATESGAAACIYAFVITFFIYREAPLSRMRKILFNSTKTLAMVMCLIATANAFGWILAYLKVPELATNALLSISDNKYVILMLVNILLLILGCPMDLAPCVLICTPILLPVMTHIGVDPVHFGIIMLLNLAIGLVTPPVGTAMFVGCAIGDVSVMKMTKSLTPFYIAMCIVLLIVTYIPDVVMFLPHTFLPVK